MAVYGLLITAFHGLFTADYADERRYCGFVTLFAAAPDGWRAFFRRYPGASGVAGGWRSWRADRIGSEKILDYQFDGPRPGYNPADARMAHVFCALSAARPVLDESFDRAAAVGDDAPDDGPPDAIEPSGAGRPPQH